MCQEANQELLAKKQAEEQKKAEEERIAKEEEQKRAEKERQAEIDRQRAEELKAEEAKNAEKMRKLNEEQAKEAEQREKEFEKLKVFARENHGEEYDEEKGKFVKIKEPEEETKSEKEGSGFEQGKSDNPDRQTEKKENTDNNEDLKEKEEDKPVTINKEDKNKPDDSYKISALKKDNKKSNIILNTTKQLPNSSFSKTINSKKQTNVFQKSKKEQISENHNLQEDTSKGLFKKTVDKAKSVGIKGIDSVKGILPFLDSEKELIEKANQLCNVKKQLVSMSQVVYQSVKAPQIERLDKENKRPFDDYDLIRGKPAGVIVKIRKNRKVRKEGLKDSSLDFDTDKLIEKLGFSLSLKINGKLYNETLCSSNLKEEDVNYRVNLSKKTDPEEVIITTEPSNCVFTWTDLKNEYIYKFISLPTKLGEPLGQNQGEIKIEILSQLKLKNSIDDSFVKSCEASEGFKANMLDSRSFKVFFTGITGPYCGDYKNKKPRPAFPKTNKKDIEKYLNSKEVRKDFYDMFPISKQRPYKPEISLLQKNNQITFPLGSCEKGLTGIYHDAFSLKNLNLKFGGDRIIAVFDQEYKEHHKEYVKKYGDFLGLAFPNAPFWYIPTPVGDIYSLPAIQTGVAIVQRKEYDRGGVFLHEIAHTLGQLKEHYPPQNKYQKQFYCSQFTSREKLPKKEKLLFSKDEITGVPCDKYRITGGLVKQSDIKFRLSDKGRVQVWKLLNNQKSIMDSPDFIRDYNNTYSKWIDRETYQKVLSTIQNNLKIPEDFFKRIKGYTKQEPRIIQAKNKYNNLLNCSFQKRPVIVVSGIYNQKGKDRFKSFSVKAFHIKNPKNPFSFSKISMEPRKENHIKIELKRNGRLDQAMLFSRKFYMEVFFKGGRVEKKEMENTPVFASFFPICESFNEKDYTISVKEVFIENGSKKENTLINSAPIKLEENKGIEI